MMKMKAAMMMGMKGLTMNLMKVTSDSIWLINLTI